MNPDGDVEPRALYFLSGLESGVGWSLLTTRARPYSNERQIFGMSFSKMCKDVSRRRSLITTRYRTYVCWNWMALSLSPPSREASHATTSVSA